METIEEYSKFMGRTPGYSLWLLFVSQIIPPFFLSYPLYYARTRVATDFPGLRTMDSFQPYQNDGVYSQPVTEKKSQLVTKSSLNFILARIHCTIQIPLYYHPFVINCFQKITS